MTLTGLFANLAVSLPSRVVVALGMGWLSFEAYKTMIESFVTQALSSYNTIPVKLFQLFSLAGFTDALGIVLAAFSAVAAIFSIKVLGHIGGGSAP